MSKAFPEWWKHGQKVRTASDGILTLNISEDAEYWLTNDAGKEVSVFSVDILGPASTPEACRMTTDITELAPAMKEAAEHYQSVQGIARYSKTADAKERFLELANPANVLTLVEALEKAQRANAAQDDHINQQADRIESLEKKNGELGRRLYQYSMEPGEAERRIAELESRTVKLPPKIERDDADGWFMFKGGRVGGGAAEWYNKALDDVSSSLTADGIKWEAE